MTTYRARCQAAADRVMALQDRDLAYVLGYLLADQDVLQRAEQALADVAGWTQGGDGEPAGLLPAAAQRAR